MSQVVVLGSSGMLGSCMARTLKRNFENVQAISRKDYPSAFRSEMSLAGFLADLGLGSSSYIVNCIGWIPQRASGDALADEGDAEFANVVVPSTLHAESVRSGAQIIQVGTDCVFSGTEVVRDENTSRAASDLYGSTKIRGEDLSPRTMLVRCSIVGKSPFSGGKSLFDWLLGQPDHSQLVGYVDQVWNGVTVHAFSQLVAGIISADQHESGVFHWVPADSVSKFELLKLAIKYSQRSDLTVLPGNAEHPKNMTLSTVRPEQNYKMWQLAGYGSPQRIESLIREYFERECAD